MTTSTASNPWASPAPAPPPPAGAKLSSCHHIAQMQQCRHLCVPADTCCASLSAPCSATACTVATQQLRSCRCHPHVYRWRCIAHVSFKLDWSTAALGAAVAVQQDYGKTHAADESKAAETFVQSKFDQQKVHTIRCIADAHQTAEGHWTDLGLTGERRSHPCQPAEQLAKSSEHLVTLAVL